MKLHGNISKITPELKGYAWVNINDTIGGDGIMVSVNRYLCPTYLLLKNNEVNIVQFNRLSSATEWLIEHQSQYDSIEILGPTKVVENAD